MRTPNFIIMGFPKCGTTSLHHYLEEHPNIFMPNQKELHYFLGHQKRFYRNKFHDFRKIDFLNHET